MKLQEMLKRIKRNKHTLKRADRRKIWKELYTAYGKGLKGETRAEKKRAWRQLWKELKLT